MKTKKSNSIYLDMAEKAVIKGGKILLKYFRKLDTFETKHGAGIVTAADKESESVICEYLLSRTKDFSILTEESGLMKKAGPGRWILDPLDGTTNFFHGFPCFNISLALEVEGEIIAGVVYDPLHKDLYKALKGNGAYKNNKRIRVSSTRKLADSMLGTGFAYMKNKVFDKNIEIFRSFSMKSQGIRRPGAAALDLCFLASGVYDGFFEQTLKAWDIAAGSLLITEAGGRITDYRGSPFSIYGTEILGSNGLIHDEMIKTISGLAS